MRSVNRFLRFSLVAFVALMVAKVDAQEILDVNGDYDVTDADIPESAGIFYVRTNGNDANSGSSPSQAFRTIRRAAIMVPAGSTIYVGAGTYTTSTTFLGVESTATYPLRIVADVNGIRTGDSGPVILGPGTRMTILRCDHVRVIGFTFQGPTDRCFVWRRSTQGHVQDCTFIGGSNGVKVRSGDVKFQGCLVQDFAANGIDVYGTAELFMDDCDVENCGSSGLQVNRYAKVTIESSRFLNNAGDGVSLDDISSTDDDLATIPLTQRIQDVVNLLAATMPDATQKGSDKMADAIARLDVALLAKYWQDPWHPHNKQTKDAARDMGLDADEGFEVFRKIKEALDKLKDFNNPDKDLELGNFGTVKSNVQLAHAWLLEATEATAFLALEEAFLVNSDTDVLKDFYKEYKKAAKEIDKGHYYHAAEKYGKAWEDAAKEAGSGYAGLNGVGTDNDDAPDAEAARFLTISDSTFNSNAYGIRCLIADSGFSATGSTFTGNTTSGASVLGAGTFSNCVFEANLNGLQITNDTTGAVTLVGSQIIDNTDYGVWCDACTLTFDATMQADWSVQNNGSNFGATGSTLTFDGFTISNGTTYGVVSENGTLNLTNSTLTTNGTGAYVDASSTLVASGSNFTGNTAYGASILGQASLLDCSFDHNTHGLQFVNKTAGEVTCSGTTVSDNTQSGLHLESCTLTLSGSGIDGLTLSDNQYGIYSTNSALVFDSFNSSSNTYGVWLSSSDVTMTNSTFTGSTYGLWATNNNSLSVESSSFSGNGSLGVYLEGNGALHNCSITGNGDGLYVNTTNVTDANLTGTDISSNTGYGIYIYNASLDLTSQATEGWSIDSNGYNVAGYQADIVLTGVSITNATNYGVYAEYGSVNLQQSTISSIASGVWGSNTDAFTIDRSHISGANTGSRGVANVDGGLVMRNTVVSGAEYGVHSSGLSKPATIYNATIADASLYGVYVDDGDLTVMNTIISGTNATYGLYRGPSANLTHSYNLVSGFAAAFENTTADATEVLAPPHFVDAANGDFSLAKGSPAINSGADLTASHTIDMLGNPRPSRKVFEIGAYEYMLAGGSLRVLGWKEDK